MSVHKGADQSPYDGAVLLADTSAWTRAHHPSVRAEWIAALSGGQIATSPMVELELLYTARTAADFDRWAQRLAQLRNVPITRSVTNAARQALRALAHKGHHRAVTIADLLIAACAQDAALPVLHYDHDFDTLTTALSFDSRWIAPRGSLDRSG
jgi:predicted nucleic acid-binding protein